MSFPNSSDSSPSFTAPAAPAPPMPPRPPAPPTPPESLKRDRVRANPTSVEQPSASVAPPARPANAQSGLSSVKPPSPPRAEPAARPKAHSLSPLRATAPSGATTVHVVAERKAAGVDDLLKTLVNRKGSDLHLACGSKPLGRIDGDIGVINETFRITPEWMVAQIEGMVNEKQLEEYNRNSELDFSYGVEGYGRFRVNLFRQLGKPGAVMRSIPSKIMTLEELGLPAVFNDITHKPNGLVLVTGPTGSGKSTTLAAMIEARNRTYPEHIMTIEDPIEFTYESKKAIINQREVGADTDSFHEALRRVLRQDPDVILIGELRDAETTKIALTAAETGHLVFGTLHTQTAAKSINRIIDQFPSDQQNQIRSQLGETLRAIISQSLMKRVDGGRVAATEVLVTNTAIANQINTGSTKAIYSSIQTGKRDGMHTLDQNLIELIRAGIIAKEEAMPFMVNKKELDMVY